MASRPLRDREHQETGLVRPDTSVNGPLQPAPDFTERDFRIAAMDSQGRTERIHVRLPPYMVRAVQVLVGMRIYPWAAPSDAFRFAIYWGLKLLHDLPPEVSMVFSQVQAMNDILLREQDAISFKHTFEKAREIVLEYQRENALGEARRLIGELGARINQMPDGYWKEKYRSMVRQEFGYVMRGDKMPILSAAARLAQASGETIAAPVDEIGAETETDELSGDGEE